MNSYFHSRLCAIESGHPLLPNTLGFLCSVLSLSRSRDDLWHDCDLDACNWMYVFSVADGFFVAPLLYARIKQKNLEAVCPQDFVAALQVVHEANQARNINYKEILLDGIRALNLAGIKPILLKGSHAIMGLGPDAEERFVSDADLLVTEEQIPAAKQALLRAGFYQDPAARSEIDASSPHQLIPFYHASSSGYIELHRYPNHALEYPLLGEEWFSPKVLLYKEQDGVCFYSNHPWQMLLYNQVHHYHGSIRRFGSVDLRYLMEQSALYVASGNDEFLRDQIEKVLGKHASRAYVQFMLLNELFGDGISGRLTSSRNNIVRELKQILGILLLNPVDMNKQRRSAQLAFIPFALKRGMDIHWLGNHLLNPAWLRLLPYKLRGVFGGGVRLE